MVEVQQPHKRKKNIGSNNLLTDKIIPYFFIKIANILKQTNKIAVL